MHRLGTARSLRVTLLRQLLLIIVALGAVLTLNGPAQAQGPAVEPEGFVAYQPQVSCDPIAKPGVVAFRALLRAKFGGGDLGIARSCGVGGLSEHKEGRAWDYALNAHRKADRVRARKATTWLTKKVDGEVAARARRLGVMYLIWNRQIWSAYRPSDGWRPYTGANPHTDHIHVSFTWNGATKRTSWWTGKVQPFDYGPCQKWVGELAPRWRAPRLEACPVALQRPKADKNGIYRAQSGETVTRVARFFHISTDQVRRWNSLAKTGPIAFFVGERVRVRKP